MCNPYILYTEWAMRDLSVFSSVRTLCGAADSWRHAFIDCTISRSVWALADPKVNENLHGSDEGEARLWLANMFETLDHDKLTRVLITLWVV
jgi:hypothetical protein